jgi:hypothetical protein
MVPIVVVQPDGNLEAARTSKRAHSYSVAHFAFAHTYEAKDVPGEWQADIDQRLARYDYKFHAVFTDDNPNHLLFADRPAIQDYLVSRMFWIGPPKRSVTDSTGCSKRRTSTACGVTRSPSKRSSS